MALDKLSQITEVGIKSGITLRNINVEGAYVSGVITATSLAITGAGISIAGVVTATSFDGNVTGRINPTSLNVSGVSTFNANIFLGDGDIAYFGDGQDLLIFHNSTDSIIRDNGTGDLFIEGGNRIKLTNPTGIETYAVFNQDGASELWYDNVKKLETTNAGVTVTGISSVSGGFVGNLTGNVNATGLSTFSNIRVSTGSSITVGSAFIQNNAVGLGQTTTTGRNAGVSTAQGTLIFNSDTGSVQVYNGNAWRDVGKEAMSATGGLVNEYTDSTIGKIYRAHIFTSSGFFTVNSASPTETVDYLVVGGGGSGNLRHAGGGGAGALRYASGLPISVSPGSYTITVGSGGVSATSVGTTPSASDGSSSSIASPLITTITAPGGGGGGNETPSGPTSNGRPGGSGGGGGGSNSVTGGASGGSATGSSGGTDSSNSPSTGWGNAGGNAINQSSPPLYNGGGGGGAGGAGSNAGSGGGNGGNGLLYSVTGISTAYAGGGGGGGFSGAPSGNGGTGGGGSGFRGNDTNPAPSLAFGVVSTGAGGGGRGEGTPTSANPGGGSGGSGIVVVRYEIGQVGGTAKATGGAISYTPTTTVHTFYSSGVFTVTNPALTSVDYLVVAGGGGGGADLGGGGGAGGLKYAFASPVSSSPGVYVVTVGSGGAGGQWTGSPATAKGGINGSNSSFGSISGTLLGGGGAGGRSPNPIPGSPGGSGGGGGYGPGSSGGSGSGFPGPNQQGFPGGAGQNPGGAGGGGGAGAAGTNGIPGGGPGVDGVPGGIGLALSISGTLQYYAGGGGGGPLTPSIAGKGGLGGGGDSGAIGITPNGSNGVMGTGGGGGGGAPGSPPGFGGGNGGSGIVIIAYPS